MKEDLRRSKSLWTTTEDKTGLHVHLDVPGCGALDLRIVTIDEATGRVEIRAAISEGQ